jgi:DNA repair exonuclease SbcCD ATPase subunit
MPIHHIFHISDIHIRVGDSERSREQEYLAAFTKLFEELKASPHIRSALIAVTGDLFHNKHLIGPPGIEIAVQLLRGLSELAPTVVIRGNHDYRQDMPLEKDLISALTAYNIPNLHYFNETGCYEIENIGIGLVAIQDALLANSTSGIAKKLPSFPSVKDFSEEVTHRVALFHGSITRARLQNGTLYDSADGYPLEWFDEYDLVLLGDIHLQQVNRATKVSFHGTSTVHATKLTTYRVEKGTWAYPGSLVQQDFGEPLLGHGYLHWDLARGEVTEYHIHNPYGVVKLQLGVDEVAHVMLQKDTLMPLNAALREPWFPQYLQVRVLGKGIKCNAELLDQIRRGLQDNGRKVLSICEMYAPTKAKAEEEESEGSDAFDLGSLNSPETWKQYILENCLDPVVQKNTSWYTWLTKPDQLLIPVTGIPEAVLNGVQTLNDKVYKLIEAFQKEAEVKETGCGSVVLKQLEWSWLFNYGAKNHFNFSELEGQLVVLNAKNGHGKSNFFEVICLALFGEGFPSRENTNYSTAIINSQTPPNTNASTRIVFGCNGSDYCIERVFRIMTGKNNIHQDVLTLRSLPSYEIVKQGSLAVKGWLASHIGSKTTFLSSCMLTQDGDCNFFGLEKSEQKKLIDNVFSLNAVQKLEGLLKEACKAHGLVSGLLSSYLAGVKEQKRGDKSQEELIGVVSGLEGRLMELEGEIAMMHEGWSAFSPRTFERGLDVYEAELAGLVGGVAGDVELLKKEQAVLESKGGTRVEKVARPSGLSVSEKAVERVPVLKAEREGLQCEGGTVQASWTIESCRRILTEWKSWEQGWKGLGFTGTVEVPDLTELRRGAVAAERALDTLLLERVEGAPHKVSTVGQLRVALTKIEDQLDSCKSAETFERRIELLEKVKREYPLLETEWKKVVADLATVSQTIQEYETYPFNPSCSACLAQPWKAVLEEAKKQKVRLLDEKKRIKPLVATYDDEYGSLEVVEGLLKEEEEGLKERQDLEELQGRTQTWIEVGEWLLNEKKARAENDRLQKELSYAEEKRGRAQQYETERTQWSIRGPAAAATLQGLLDIEIKNLEQWADWYAWTAYSRLVEVGGLLKKAEVYRKREEVEGIVEAFPAFLEESRLLEERSDLLVSLQKAKDRLGEGRGGEEVRDALKEVDVRQELLRSLSTAFKGYREWLYTAKLAPMLQKGVNGLLEHMCEGRPLFLEPEWLATIDTFTWFLRDGANRVVIEKASGFQRFITGMAMRVAMSRLGISRTVYQNLIIDEGFTACDGENLEKVPAFLRRLLVDGSCKGILLATHLDELKVRLEKQLRIARDELSGIACLQVGTYALPVPPAVMKGRKTKATVSA